MEAPQGVELTGTNGGKAIILHHPGPGWWPVLRPSDGSLRQGASGMRHKTFFRVHCPVPGPSRSDPPGVCPGKVDKVCGGHGQGETPGPIPNPEAKALHGDGTAPERVWESSAPPLHTIRFPPVEPLSGLPGGSSFFSPPHARAGGPGGAARTPGTPGRNPYEPTGTESKQLTCGLHIAGVEPKSTGRTRQSSMIPSTFTTVWPESYRRFA